MAPPLIPFQFYNLHFYSYFYVICAQVPCKGPVQEKQPGTKEGDSTLESERPGLNSKLYHFAL